MARRDSGQEQLDLIIGGVRIRRTERRTAAAIRRAKEAGLVADIDDAQVIVAIELARAVDRASSIKPDPYAVAVAARELREALTALRMTPAARGEAKRDALADFLDSLNEDDAPADQPPQM